MTDRAAVIRRLHQRASTVITSFSSAMPGYDDAPRALVEADVVHGIRVNIDLFFHYLSTGVMPTDAQLQPVVDLAITRHADGVALDDILGIYQTGSVTIWERTAGELGPADHAVLIEASTALVRYLTGVTGRIAAAIRSDAAPQHHWGTADARRVVATALLDGADPGPWATVRAGDIATSFCVCVLAPTAAADPVALRSVVTAITDIPGAFVVADHDGWTALVPALDGDQTGDATARALDEANPRDGAPTFWAGVSAPTSRAGIPRARAEATLVCSVARTEGRHDEMCTGAMVLFGFAVATAAAAHPHLRRVLAALDSDPILHETVRTHLASGSNTVSTAARMHVHRNTVGYRLARVAAVTGHDPRTTEGGWVLGAALRLAALSRSTAGHDGRVDGR
ncbi:PucR family transcriptional regulator [Williamsia sp. MIQD14]|uniref:PucR family transcriptional regulator n=1 Tax=Williamsia sp. MIQD14 TaxID=3425703 RepID=UPI003DA0CEF9